MTPSIEDQLGQLVTKIAGFRTGSSAWSKAVQRSKYKLRYEKCTSTSEKEVDASYDGLIDKFDIKGHTELSKALKTHKSEYLQSTRPLFNGDINQTLLKYDLLRLLASLSSSHNQNYDYAPTLPMLSDTNNLTWEEIIQEDPLEGDHWKTWSDATATDEDELSDPDGFELDEQEIHRASQTAWTSAAAMPEVKVDDTHQMDIDSREDPEALGYLMTQQYWRDGYTIDHSEEQGGSIMTHPCKLSQALGRLLYNETERRELKTITEAGVIREVLGFLRGYSGVIFQSHNNTFIMDETYIVQHLSQRSLMAILREFYGYGRMLADLRHTVDRILQQADYGQTCQAFAECVYKSLLDLDHKLSTFEAGDDPSTTVSLLRLKCDVSSLMSCFHAIHEVASGIPFDSGSARDIATYLLSSLYSRALTSQASGQSLLYDALMYTWQQTMVPYGRIMDDWVFFGSLTADKYKESYVSRNELVSMDDPNFWANGFSIQPIHLITDNCYACPMFDTQMISRIFFTGKAINLLSQIEEIKKKPNLVDSMTQRLFDEVVKDSLKVKPPYIEPVQSKPVVATDKSEYVCALFPLARRQGPALAGPTVEKSDVGLLLDQQFMRAMDTYIQEPYQRIANDLNKVLHQQCELKEQLESLASVYLMLENDLMHSFCEAVFSRMDLNEPWFDNRILNQLFTEACETSGYHETAFVEAKEIDATKTIASYLECVEFKIEISWPLNNFIHKEQLPSYSKILSFLLRLKRAKYVMEKKTLFTKQPTVGSAVMRFYSLRMKMLWFINAFWRYIMTTILHAETINFRDKLSLSKDADEITELHNAYVRRLVDRCLLNEKASAIRKSIMSILDMTEQMKTLFDKHLELNQDISQLGEVLNTVERDFSRTNEFITISLTIMGKKAGLPWFESLATSLSAQ